MKWRFPISPVAASRPRVSRWGSYYTGAYKTFRADAKPIVEEVTKGVTPTADKLKVWVECFVTKPATTKLSAPRPDVDNYLKSIFDLLNGVIWEDDSQIVFVQASKAWSDNDGYFTVKVQKVKE